MFIKVRNGVGYFEVNVKRGNDLSHIQEEKKP